MDPPIVKQDEVKTRTFCKDNPINEYILLDDYSQQRNSALSSLQRASIQNGQYQTFEKPQPLKIKLLNGDKVRILDLFI